MTDEPIGEGRWAHVARLPVLGVWTRFATDSAEVIDRVRQVYGGWAGLEAEKELLTPSPGTVTIATEEGLGAARSSDDPPFYHHRMSNRTRLFVLTDGGVGVADAERLESIAYVDRRVLRWPHEFTEGMLEPLTLFLLGAQDRQPLHAAAIERNGTAILLAGPSGTGKSTLAFAALRNGFHVLADEPVYVQLQPRLRVWGRRSRLHLSPDAPRHFAELRNEAPIRLPTGKTKIVVDGGARAIRHAEKAGLCLLRRGTGGSPSLERTSADAAVRELGSALDPGFDLYADTIAERIRHVAARGVWRLTLGDSPLAALRLLEEVAEALEADG